MSQRFNTPSSAPLYKVSRSWQSQDAIHASMSCPSHLRRTTRFTVFFAVNPSAHRASSRHPRGIQRFEKDWEGSALPQHLEASVGPVIRDAQHPV